MFGIPEFQVGSVLGGVAKAQTRPLHAQQLLEAEADEDAAEQALLGVGAEGEARHLVALLAAHAGEELQPLDLVGRPG